MTPLIAETAHRAERHTPEKINRQIHDATRRRVRSLRRDPAALRARLHQLDREWDIERCLETGSATLTLTGLALGVLVNRRWLLLSGVVQGFFRQHALQGWCPPLPAFRAMGVRTQREIEEERHEILALLEQHRTGDEEWAQEEAFKE